MSLPRSPHQSKMWVFRRIAPRCAILCTLLFALPAFSAPSKPAMPTAPLALLQLGAQRNGLTAPDLRPWHIQVSYQTYKPNGRRKQSGTFEEWWAAPNEYHLRFDRKGYHLQAWITPRGSFAIGNPDLPITERLVYRWIVAPIPQQPDLRGAHLRYRVRLIGPNQFPCVQITSRQPTPADLPQQYPTYCFESNRPILRIINTQVSEIVTITASGALRGQYLPQRFYATLDARPILSVTLQQGQSYTRMDPSFFTPPANAKPAPPPSTGVLYLTAQEAATHLTPGSTRIQSARILRESQVHAALAVTIGADGRVQKLRILSSIDPELIAAIYQSVKQWRYRPFLLHGIPVPVRTQIILDDRVPLPK